MTITHNLTMDLQKTGEPQYVHVVQGDAFTRTVTLTLLSGGEPWQIPQCMPAVRYLRPDGQTGAYDAIMGSIPAISWVGNVMTVALKPTIMEQPGVVQVQVQLRDQDYSLSVFPFLVVVEPMVAPGTEVV